MSPADHPSRWEPSDGEPAPSATELVEQFLASCAHREPRHPVNLLAPLPAGPALAAVVDAELPDLEHGISALLAMTPAFQVLTINRARHREP